MAKTNASLKELPLEAVIQRLQSILINAAEGRRSLGDDQQYPNLRREMLRRIPNPPVIASAHTTVDSFMAYIKGIDDRGERVRRIRAHFEPLLDADEGEKVAVADSSTWGAPQSRTARLKTVRTLLPLAQAAVESMITTLSEPNPNGAPILEERAEALTHLRELHRTLGELLGAVDAGRFDDDLGQGLLAESARYAKRAARSLRDDPMPYLASALLLGVFHACGLPGIGGYIGGVALNIKKHGRQEPKRG